MALELQQASSFTVSLSWVSALGYILAAVVSLPLLFQSLYAYIKLFHCNKDKNEPVERNKIPYIFVIIYLMLASCFAVCDTLTTSNIITGTDKEEYQEWKCLFASCIAWIVGGVNVTILFVFFLYRIMDSFKGSDFAYKPCIYRVFFVISLCPAIFSIGGLYFVIDDPSYIIQYDMSSNFAFCASAADDKQTAVAYSIIIALMGISIFIGYFALLYLFIKGLWSLNKQMMKHFMREYVEDPSTLVKLQSETQTSTSTPHSPYSANSPNSPCSPTIEMSSNNMETDRAEVDGKEYAKLSMKHVLKSWDRQSFENKKRCKVELQRIVKLHNLIKKQTILVVIVIITDIIVALAASINMELTSLNGWDVMINAICVWLMIDTSNRYWDKCKHTLCLCCYYKTKDIDI